MTFRHRCSDVADWADRNQPRLAAVAIVVTFAASALFVGSVTPEARGDTLEIAGVSSPAAPDTTTGTTATAPTVRPVVEPSLVVSGATPPTRGSAVQVTDTVPPTTPAPIDGDCESWRPLLDRYGIPFDEARPIMWRESRCLIGAHNGSRRTRDDSFGPFQVNRFGSLADWWDSAGYTASVMSTPEGAVAAAAVLYHSCRWSPWRRPYGCDGDYLQTPSPAWGDWNHQQENQS